MKLGVNGNGRSSGLMVQTGGWWLLTDVMGCDWEKEAEVTDV